MNRKTAKVLALLLALLTLTACGRKQDKVTETTISLESQTEATEKETLPFGIADIADQEAFLNEENYGSDVPKATISWNTGTNSSKSEAQTETTGPAETNGQANQETVVPAEASPSASCGCDFEAYLSMSTAEQEAYATSFASIKDFIEWYNAAQAEHADHENVIVAAGGVIDLEDFIN